MHRRVIVLAGCIIVWAFVGIVVALFISMLKQRYICVALMYYLSCFGEFLRFFLGVMASFAYNYSLWCYCSHPELNYLITKSSKVTSGRLKPTYNMSQGSSSADVYLIFM